MKTGDEDSETVFEHIVIWMKTVFNDGETDFSIQGLSTFRTIAECLSMIDPEFFDESNFLELISSKTCVESSIGVKLISMRKVYTALSEYYELYCGLDLRHFCDPTPLFQDFANYDYEAAVTLLTIVVGAAFLGRHAATYVEKVNNLPEPVQVTIASRIQLLKSLVEQNSSHSAASFSHNDVSSSHGHNSSSEIIIREKAEHERVIEEMQAKIARLTAMNKAQEEQLSMAQKTESSIDEDEVDLLRNELHQVKREGNNLRHELTQAQHEIQTHTAARQRMLEEAAEKDETIRKLSHDLQSTSQLRDECEMLREQEKTFTSTRIVLERKLKSLSEENEILKKSAKVYEGKINEYISQQMEHDDTKTRCNALSAVVASLKQESDIHSSAIHDLGRKLDARDLELAMSEESRKELEQTVRQLKAEKAALMEENLRTSVYGPSSLQDSMAANEGDENEAEKEKLANMEKMMRLEIENARLKEHAGKAHEVEELKTQIEDLRRKNGALESELKHEGLRAVELKAKLETLQRQQESPVVANENDRAQRFNLEKMHIDLRKLEERAVSAERLSAGRLDEIEQLKQKCTKLESDLNIYLERAKCVIVDQEAQCRSVGAVGFSVQHFDSMRRELEQKDAEISKLKAVMERQATMHEQESRLMTTAFHKMASNVRAYQRGDDSASDGTRERGLFTRHTPTFNFSWLTRLILIVLLVGLLSAALRITVKFDPVRDPIWIYEYV